MKRLFITVIVILVVFSGCATMGAGKAPMPPDLNTYSGLATALENQDSVFVYDVRTPEEYVTGHVPGAINIPHGEIAKKLPFWKKNHIIVVYCASGGRSYMAYESLSGKRFKRVVDFGGVGNWEGELVEGVDP